MPFTPGTPKPPGSGMQPGQKTRKVLARENANSEVLSEMRRIVDKTDGLNPDEIFRQMRFDPLVYAILMLEKDIDAALRVKLLDLLLKKRYPDLRAVEVSGETTSEIKITFGLPSYDQGQVIEGQPSGRLTDGSQTSLQAVQDAIWGDDEGEGAEIDEDRSTSL